MARPDYDFRKYPCIRIQDGHDFTEEAHICFFCGEPIQRIGAHVSCEVCGLVKCPACSHCLCTAPEDLAWAAVRMHKIYCCTRENFMSEGFPVGLDLIERFDKPEVAAPAMAAIEQCRRLHEKQAQGKTAFPFLENLGSGQFLDPDAAAKGEICYKGFRYDLARLLRYQTAIEYIIRWANKVSLYPRSISLKLLEIGPGYIDTVKSLLQLRPFFSEVAIDVIDINIGNLIKGFNLMPADQQKGIAIWEADMTGDLSHWAADRLGTYDVITMFETIEHFKPDRVPGVLFLLHTLLKSDGALLISSPRAEVEPASMWPGHRKHYTDEEMKVLFKQAHFRLKRFWGNRSIDEIAQQGISKVLTQEANAARFWPAAIKMWALTGEASE